MMFQDQQQHGEIRSCLKLHGSEVTECRVQSMAHLFFGTVATDHPGGQFHGVVLVLVMAPVTGVSPATAGKPEGSHGTKLPRYSTRFSQ